MTELRTQIYGIVSTVSGITGGVTFSDKQEAAGGAVAVYPYLVFSFLASPRERADSTPIKIRFAKVQFDLVGKASLDAIADDIEAALDDTSNYSFMTDSLLSVFEDFRNGPFQIDRDDSANLWQLTFQYTFKIQEA